MRKVLELVKKLEDCVKMILMASDNAKTTGSAFPDGSAERNKALPISIAPSVVETLERSLSAVKECLQTGFRDNRKALSGAVTLRMFSGDSGTDSPVAPAKKRKKKGRKTSIPRKLTRRKKTAEAKSLSLASQNRFEYDTDNEQELLENENIHTSSKGLLKKIFNSSKNSGISGKKQKLYKCPICNKISTDHKFVKRHAEMHSGVRHTCQICGKSLSSKQSLRIHHQLLHSKSGVKTFACQICQKPIKTQGGLKQHMDRHYDIRKYPCSVCHKAFFSTKELREHTRIHTGDKPWSCDVCGKSFSQRSYLKVHGRTHTDVRPYVCTECGVSFRYSSCLYKHLKEKHGIESGGRPSVNKPLRTLVNTAASTAAGINEPVANQALPATAQAVSLPSVQQQLPLTNHSTELPGAIQGTLTNATNAADLLGAVESCQSNFSGVAGAAELLEVSRASQPDVTNVTSVSGLLTAAGSGHVCVTDVINSTDVLSVADSDQAGYAGVGNVSGVLSAADSCQQDPTEVRNAIGFVSAVSSSHTPLAGVAGARVASAGVASAAGLLSAAGNNGTLMLEQPYLAPHEPLLHMVQHLHSQPLLSQQVQLVAQPASFQFVNQSGGLQYSGPAPAIEQPVAKSRINMN